MNIESLSLENTVCQVLDMINPKETGMCEGDKQIDGIGETDSQKTQETDRQTDRDRHRQTEKGGGGERERRGEGEMN